MMGELMFTTVDYIFFIALAFTILALISSRSEKAVLSMSAAVGWIILAVAKYVSEASVDFVSANLAVFFFGLGVVMLVYAIQLLLELMRERRFGF